MLRVVDVQRVSTDSAGNEGNGGSYISDSYGPVFSPDGTKLASLAMPQILYQTIRMEPTISFERPCYRRNHEGKH